MSSTHGTLGKKWSELYIAVELMDGYSNDKTTYHCADSLKEFFEKLWIQDDENVILIREGKVPILADTDKRHETFDVGIFGATDDRHGRTSLIRLFKGTPWKDAVPAIQAFFATLWGIRPSEIDVSEND